MLRSVRLGASSAVTRFIRYFVAAEPEAADSSTRYVLVIFGGSGDLATRKLIPALWALHRSALLPPAMQIIAYARSEISDDDFRARVVIPSSSSSSSTQSSSSAAAEQPASNTSLAAFMASLHYVRGDYGSPEDCSRLSARIDAIAPGANRIFYLALPPDVFVLASTNIRESVYAAPPALNRVVIESPFGRDAETSMATNIALGFSFHEEEIYRIDHYLGSEMVKNLMILRFANTFFGSVWDRQYISNVQITFKESDASVRSSYFDSYGVIREVMQSHLIQILAIVAMDRPVSQDPEDVRNEKVKVLRRVRPATIDDVMLGQYVADAAGVHRSYTDEPGVDPNSTTPTLAVAILDVLTERWEGVKFVLRCGKAVDERKLEIRVQFNDVPADFYPGNARNELVIRVLLDEAVYMKFTTKQPGLSSEVTVTEVDLSHRYRDVVIPEAYESLLLDVIKGDKSNFVRDDELDAAWRIFTPLLEHLEREPVKPLPYEWGSRGPAGMDEFVRTKGGYVHGSSYKWKK